MPVDPQLGAVLDLVNAATPMAEQDPEGARAGFRRLCGFAPADQRAEVAAIEETKVEGAEGPLRARVYRPAVEGDVPTVVLFHGGGFVIGDLDTHDSLARRICAGVGAVVVSVDYRLAPEDPFPAAPHDAIAATRDVLARAEEFGGRSDRVAVAGDSAGGNLSAVAAQHVPGLAAQFLIYPATDVLGDYASRQENAEGYFLDLPTMAWFMGHYAEGADFTDPLLSPLRGDLAGLPPAVVVTAELDPLRDEGDAYAAALAEAGVSVDHTSYPGMIHGFANMDALSAGADQALSDAISRFAAVLTR